MKDLLLYVADADAQAFLKSILKKPRALSIRTITFDIERHPQKDSGMLRSGAELARLNKYAYRKAILAWDHHGSGREHRQSPEEVRAEMQGKLDSFTWRGNSSVAVFVPELEQWLWYCENALLEHFEVGADQLLNWLQEYSQRTGISVEDCKTEHPKELFEFVMRDCLRRTISPRDFEHIGNHAGVKRLMSCDTFGCFVRTLRLWFPESE